MLTLGTVHLQRQIKGYREVAKDALWSRRVILWNGKFSYDTTTRNQQRRMEEMNRWRDILGNERAARRPREGRPQATYRRRKSRKSARP